jgi:hypothetical protein
MRGMIAALINVRGGWRNCQGGKEQFVEYLHAQNRIPQSTPRKATEDGETKGEAKIDRDGHRVLLGSAHEASPAVAANSGVGDEAVEGEILGNIGSRLSRREGLRGSNLRPGSFK